MNQLPETLICLSHLRWNFVYQRPQHIMTGLSGKMKVFYVEEPIFDAPEGAWTEITVISESITLVTPHLKPDGSISEHLQEQARVLDTLVEQIHHSNFILWYYTPMALGFSSHLKPHLTVYDCMDELSAFKFAPAELIQLESELLERADLVFTGGHTLFEAKRSRHANVYPFPSSIDKRHFGKARQGMPEPNDQRRISGVKIGFFGVVDERFDLDLIEGIATSRPDWNVIIIGPVVKIDELTLPRANNIHYLGQRSYDELPAYLSGWSVALIPFLLNESTKYISPTKTPEYLAAGIPVVSTPITDVVTPYGTSGLVYIAHDVCDFVTSIENELSKTDKSEWLSTTDLFLSNMSWENTINGMVALMEKLNPKTPIEIDYV